MASLFPVHLTVYAEKHQTQGRKGVSFHGNLPHRVAVMLIGGHHHVRPCGANPGGLLNPTVGAPRSSPGQVQSAQDMQEEIHTLRLLPDVDRSGRCAGRQCQRPELVCIAVEEIPVENPHI